MSTYKVCRICLRSDQELQKLDKNILNFYKELCDSATDGTKHYYCSICQHLLKKSYNFKNKCLKSNKIFQQWRKNKYKDRPLLSDLYKSLPPSPLGINVIDTYTDINIHESDENTGIIIKDETADSIYNVNYDDVNKDSINRNIENHLTKYDVKINEEFGHCENNYLQGSDLSDDNKCLLEYVKDSKKKIKASKRKKKKEKEIIIKTEDDRITKPKQRRPLKDHKEYETVFDIQLFTTEAEVREEFAQRKLSEYYLSAKHKCDVCYTVYKCEKLVQFHMRWHDVSAGDFPCDVCAMRFKTYVSMRKHKTDVHFGRFRCKKCPLVTYHKMVMILHYRKHQGVSYMCKYCKRTYNHSSTYMSHLRKSHRTEHVCVSCAQTFVSEKGLAVHRKKVHNASSKFDLDATAQCAPCGLTFANQLVYNIHVLNTAAHKDLANTLIACPECGLELDDKLQVRAHRRQMHPQYNFSAMKRAESGCESGQKCPLCGLSGTHNTWLYRHFQSAHPAECYAQAVHSERRKHLCDQCGKSFYNITQLTEHSYSHSGLKPFRCGQCPAAFRSNTHLKFHLERHAPASRACLHCGKKFVSAANLSNHMRSHIGDRRYKCSLCTKGFLHGSALREHVRGVHLHIRRARRTVPK